MSQRYENGKLKYKIIINQNQISVQFLDNFAQQYLRGINTEQLFDQNIQIRYLIKKSNSSVLTFLLKFNIPFQEHVHDQLIKFLQKHLDLDYYYFKATNNQSYIQRNNKFLTVCKRPIFKILYPQITMIIPLKQPSSVKGNTVNHENTKKFKIGEILIFIQSAKKNQIKQVTKYLQTYVNQQVVLGLDVYFGWQNIKKSQFSNWEFNTIIQKLINFLNPKFKEIGIQCKLNILKIDPYVPFSKKQKYQAIDDKFGIVFDIQGMFQSLPQFYLNLASLLKTYPILIEKVQNIQFTSDYTPQDAEKNFLKNDSLVIFFGSDKAVAVLNFSSHYRQWYQFKKQLKKRLFIISEAQGFSLTQLQILIKQHKQVEIFMDEEYQTDFMDYTFKPINQKSFFLQCQKQTVNKFIKRAFDYLQKNQKVQVQRNQFTTEFQIYIFWQFIRGQIQAQYPSVIFKVKYGILYSTSKQADLNSIEEQLQHKRRYMLKKIVRIPTIKQIKKNQKYQILQGSESFFDEINVKTRFYQFTGNNNIKIFLKSINSINSCHHSVISIIDRKFKNCKFFMENFAINNLSNERYLNYGKDKKQERIIAYNMARSKYISQMIVWYVQLGGRNNNEVNKFKLKMDIQDFVFNVLKKEPSSKLEFIIPDHMQREYFSCFFIQLCKQLDNQNKAGRVEEITIFFESKDMKKIIENVNICFLRENKDFFSEQTKLYLSPQQIQKIILTEYYSVRCWSENNNKYLSPLNSYIFNYQKSKKKQQQFKVPLFLKSVESIQKQYLICFKWNIYFKIDKACNVTKHQLIQNRPLLNFSNVIKNYFSFSEYMIVYMDQQETNVQECCLYFWQKSNENNLKQKIKRVAISQEQKLIPKKNSQVDIYVKRTDILNKYLIQTHQDFITEVKKAIFLED